MNTTLDRLEQIEIERQQTMNDPAFQKWAKKMRVSIAHVDREPILRAKEMMVDYDYSNKKKVVGHRFFSIFK